MKGVHSRTTRGWRRWRSLGPSVLLVCLAWPLSAGAQQRDALPGFGNDMTPAEVQRLFEAYELVRAQEMLDLSDEQYPQFVVGLKALQDARREGQQGRQQRLRRLQQMANQPNADDATLSDRLADLKRHDAETAEAQGRAVEALDAILNPRQQVRFRMFEQTMERRRLELLMRARRPPSRRPDQR